MKVLHAAYMSRFEPGILKQMEDEQQAAKNLNINWTSRLFCPAPDLESPALVPVPHQASRREKRKHYFHWLTTEMVNHDILLLRHIPYDPGELTFIKQLGKPVLTVHHTLEGPELRSRGGLIAHLKSWTDGIFIKKIIHQSAGIVAVTPEIATYECARTDCMDKPVLIYPNGVLLKDSHLENQRATTPELLFVASNFVPWQGLDCLYESVSASSAQCTVHVVGKIPPALQQKISSEPGFKCHGRLTTGQIEKLSTQCSAGLSSLALYRKGMKEACPLKVREYLALGLPVYGSYKESFSPDFPYYRQGDPTIESILNFVNEMAGINRQQIREEAIPHIDKTELLKNLHNSLLEHFST